MRSRTLAVIGLLAPLCAACAERLDAPLSPTFGQAVASMDAQIVPPTTAPDRPPESSAARAVIAIRRYDADRPKALEPAGTSAQGGGYAPPPPADTPPPQ